MHTCPVCGYNQLWREPEDFLICPSCGTEFGYHDARTAHGELRAQWMRRGAPWSSRVLNRPANWNAYDQLAAAGLIPSTATVSSTTERQIIISALQWNGLTLRTARSLLNRPDVQELELANA